MIDINNTLIDNSDEFKMVEYIRILLGNESCNRLRIATGYWDLPGMKLLEEDLRKFLEKGGTLDLMIGEEPTIRSYQLAEVATEDKKFPDFYIQKDIDRLTDEYKSIAQLILDYCNGDPSKEENSPIKIRVYGQKEGAKEFLHAKCYIFLGHHYAQGIVGSSNFTAKGLEDNAELNYLETQNSIITAPMDEYSNSKSHNHWFEEKWEKSEPWNGKFINDILLKSPIGKDLKPKDNSTEAHEVAPLTPYELYIKLLQSKFGDLVDVNQVRKVQEYLPKTFNAYPFQLEAVTQCYNIMQNYGGFMLADVVGLGKTIVGTMILKHFLSTPDKDNRERSVLIVTPPAIKKGWIDTLDKFGIKYGESKAVNFITTGSIGKLVDNSDEEFGMDIDDTGEFETDLVQKNYGLIIVDESHKFRNNKTTMYKKLNELIKTTFDNTGKYPYVGLLSATPQNNSPLDLKNQLYLFIRETQKNTAFGVLNGDLDAFFASIHQSYIELISPKYNNPKSEDYIPRTDEERKEELRAISEDIREKVLKYILVRRTRTDISKYKNENGEAILNFPKVSVPQPLEYKLTGSLPKLFSDTMTAIGKGEDDDATKNTLVFARYRAIEFLKKEDHRRLYEGNNVGVSRVADQLANIMQLLLVKRLESSFDAFKKSLESLMQDTENMLEMWKEGQIFICPSNKIDVHAEFDIAKHPEHMNFADRAKAIQAKIDNLTAKGENSKNNNRSYSPLEDFDPKYKVLLEHDLHILKLLCNRWKDVEDPKKDEFRRQLRELLPASDPTKKIVIFTESADTLESIVKLVKAERYSVIGITSKNRAEVQLEIQANFDENYDGERKNNIQVLVSTDVLAEGVNLHRAYTIINYDTPWNSTKLMQRIGRVNRIGSTAEEVFVYNFMPSAEGDEQIRLVNRAFTKIQAFLSTFGEDNKIFTDKEEVVHFEQMMEREANGEESPMLKYLNELKDFKAKNPVRYEEILSSNETSIATSEEPHESLFVLRRGQTAEMCIKLLPPPEYEILTEVDMLEHFRCNIDAQCISLPADWEKQTKRALRAYRNEFNSMCKRRYKDHMESARNAHENIVKHYPQWVDGQRVELNLFAQARELVEKGNMDICRLLLSIEEYLIDKGTGKVKFSSADATCYVSTKLQHIPELLKQTENESKIIMAISK